MSWSRIDDKLHAHRKVVKVGKRGADRLAAMGLWTLCLSYTCDFDTDGFIDREVVADKAGSETLGDRLAAQLVAAGFWNPVDGGWMFHDWKVYNKDRETKAAERETKREAGRAGGLARAKSIVAATSASFIQAEVKQTATASLKASHASATPVRSTTQAPIPIPIPIPIPTGGEHAPAHEEVIDPERSTIPQPIPPSSKLTLEQREYAAMQGLADIELCWEKFLGLSAERGKRTSDLFGSWKRFVADEVRYQRRERDRAAERGDQSGPARKVAAHQPFRGHE